MLRNNAMLADAHISSLGYLWFVQMVSIPAYDGHSYITDGQFRLFPSIVLFLKMPTKWERNACVCLILHRLLIDISVFKFIFRSRFFLWKFLLVESGILGFGFRNLAQGMASSTDEESRIRTGNPESIACLPQSRVQDYNLGLLD